MQQVLDSALRQIMTHLKAFVLIHVPKSAVTSAISGGDSIAVSSTLPDVDQTSSLPGPYAEVPEKISLPRQSKPLIPRQKLDPNFTSN
ncbi:hypothetical protein QE152_g22697 [Popillia japonica]|uniref:Uncharacterized protein n=1 Tax=Popillia japonica TaxID=7064 RepID=A0AAW1KK64_POPJA